MIMFATFLIFINVVLRAFGAAIPWAEEGTRYIIAWLSFIGGSLCAKHGEHVGIDLLMQVTPPKVTKFLIVFAQLLAAIFMFIFVYYGWLLTYSTMKTGQISTGVMLPMWVAYIAVPVGCLMMGLRFLERAIITFKTKAEDFAKKPTDDGDVDISRL